MDAERIAGKLPIAAIVPALLELPWRRNLVIEAPPGAGKTTVVPIALLQGLDRDHADRSEQILVVQPRRLAARLSALRVAALLGEQVGERVGYSVRFDKVTSARTRILFMTEGVLLRQLRADRGLERVAAVILDEFHERSLDGDLLLALLRARQQTQPAGPRVIVMSATLDGAPVADYLQAERLRSEGRSFAVELAYPKPSRSRAEEPPLERRVAAAVHELVERGLIGRASPGGHALVFLPGAREIRACEQRCAAIAERAGLAIHVLHGSLAKELQDRAVTGAGDKLILATNVAETSITIDGVVAVIDSGLARVAGVDPGTGMPRLELAPISRASAAQRAGRAGRTRPGVCLRLYGKHDHDHRPAFDLPEVRRLDLTAAVLELAAAGIRDPASFAWFEAPAEAALAGASELLRQLEAIDEAGALTAIGREMLRYPLHPRLARLLVAAVALGVGEEAAAVAALLGERPLQRGPARRSCDADVLEALELLERPRGAELDRGARAARKVTEQLRRQLPRSQARAPRPSSRSEREAALRKALLAAHPDRVATVRVDDHDRRTLVFAFGGSAELGEESGVRADWAIALSSEERREGTRRRAIVRSACAIDPEWLLDLFADAVVDDEQLRFDSARERVVGESALRYGKLVIESSPLRQLPAERSAALLLEAARAAGVERFCRPPGAKPSDRPALEQLRLRAAFIHRERGDFPLLDDARIDAGLAALCQGRSSFAELEQANLLAVLEAELGGEYGDHRALDRLAPRQVALAGGRKLPVTYEPDRAPWVGSRLQDFFGMREGPRILDGAVPVVLHLRAPNRHDVAVTTDLGHFWRTHYAELRRRLSRRYPKHDWREDPLLS